MSGREHRVGGEKFIEHILIAGPTQRQVRQRRRNKVSRDESLVEILGEWAFEHIACVRAAQARSAAIADAKL